VSLTQTVEVNVPVHVHGDCSGVKKGGILEHVMREVRVSCLARAIPESFKIDITDLDIGNSIHAKDLPLPEGVKLLTGVDHVVINVVAPRAEEEAPAAAVAEGAATTPEVITKGKKEEEGVAGQPAVSGGKPVAAGTAKSGTATGGKPTAAPAGGTAKK
ncbi:MAG: 50S ribosomal protein L25, partial [Elusimicrobiota bacterium]